MLFSMRDRSAPQSLNSGCETLENQKECVLAVKFRGSQKRLQPSSTRESVLLEPIPGQAHWQTRHCGGGWTIQTWRHGSTRTPWDAEANVSDTRTPEEQNTRTRIHTHRHTVRSAKAVKAWQQVPARRHQKKPEPDWSSSDTALEIHFEVKPGKQAFQKLAGIWTHSTPAHEKKAARRSSNVLEERKLFDPAKQKEIKNLEVNDTLRQLEPHERPSRAHTEDAMSYEEEVSQGSSRDTGIS